ncbi:MAG: PAS domain-containing protein, partial [Alphaproteobacteria bacterium]|nr:PAS domain-containing protein [Alphaproteobacteria bacterium]
MNNTFIFVEAIPAPVFWLDRNKVYQGCNQVFSDLIGLNAPEEIVGLTDKDFPYSSSDLSLRNEILDAILTEKIQVKILYDCIVGVQDKMIWVQKRFTPLKNHKGKIMGVFVAIVDISEKVNRRKDLETHVARIHVLESFLNELNAKPFLSINYKQLIEKSIVALQEASQASLAIFINANAHSLQSFFQVVTEPLDITKLFENRKILLKATRQSGYLDSEAIKLLQDFDLPIDSVFFYRIELNELIKYDDVILLINPNKDKLETAATYLFLAHQIVHSFHVSNFLAAAKQCPVREQSPGGLC